MHFELGKHGEFTMLIPETRLELFKVWLCSFFIGKYVSNAARPFYRSLIIDINKGSNMVKNQAAYIEHARLQLGLNWTEFAEKLGTTTKTVENWRKYKEGMKVGKMPDMAVKLIKLLIEEHWAIKDDTFKIQIIGPRQSGKFILAKFLQDAMIKAGAKKAVIVDNCIPGPLLDIDLTETSVVFEVINTRDEPFEHKPKSADFNF